jgi:hypothetical protein
MQGGLEWESKHGRGSSPRMRHGTCDTSHGASPGGCAPEVCRGMHIGYALYAGSWGHGVWQGHGGMEAY